MRPATVKYFKQYSDENFWNKLVSMAKTVGKEVITLALQLYYAMQRPDAPQWAKATIMAALGYFISPLDGIPDLVPFVGYSDDLWVLILAIGAVSRYINEDVRMQVDVKLREWFRN